jgi:hypothetical protein
MKIRALAASTAGLLFLWGGQAVAADAMSMPTPYQWSGMYFGAFVGGGWASKDWDISGSAIGSGTGSGLLRWFPGWQQLAERIDGLGTSGGY